MLCQQGREFHCEIWRMVEGELKDRRFLVPGSEMACRDGYENARRKIRKALRERQSSLLIIVERRMHRRVLNEEHRDTTVSFFHFLVSSMIDPIVQSLGNSSLRRMLGTSLVTGQTVRDTNKSKYGVSGRRTQFGWHANKCKQGPWASVKVTRQIWNHRRQWKYRYCQLRYTFQWSTRQTLNRALTQGPFSLCG